VRAFSVFPTHEEKSLNMPNHLQSRGGDDLPPSVNPPNRKSQTQQILDLLIAAGSGEVPLAEIMICAAQYNFCIHELRKRGYKILNRTETRHGVRWSWYRLESSPENLAPQSSCKKSACAQSLAAPPPSRQPQPSSSQQTLSLFPEMAVPVQQQQRPVWRDPEMNAVKHG
jgi:hypothetical protein